MRQLRSGSRGFTLMELMVVVAILGVLMAIVAPAISGMKGISVEGQVKSDGKAIQTATDTYNNRSIGSRKFPELALSDTSTQNAYKDLYVIGASGASVKLILRDHNVESLATTINKPGTTTWVSKRTFISFDAATDIYDADGSVKRVTFVPDFLSKPPNSATLKGDETKDLGATQQASGLNTGASFDANTIEEYLWLFMVNASGTDQESRGAQVFRLIRAYCGIAPTLASIVEVIEVPGAEVPPLPTSGQVCSTSNKSIALLVYNEVF